MKRFILILLLFLSLFTVVVVPIHAEDEIEEPQVIEEEEQDFWEHFVEEYLSGEKVAMYFSWLAYIGTIIGLFVKLKNLKESNNLTLSNVKDFMFELITEVTGKNIQEEIQKFLPDILKTQEKTQEIMTIFAKVLALGQENTPESRVAILNLIEELGTVGKDVTESAKEVIKQEVQLIQERKEEIESKLDNIIDNYDGTSI